MSSQIRVSVARKLFKACMYFVSKLLACSSPHINVFMWLPLVFQMYILVFIFINEIKLYVIYMEFLWPNVPNEFTSNQFLQISGHS